jgi:YVTN family beta-propeller protein
VRNGRHSRRGPSRKVVVRRRQVGYVLAAGLLLGLGLWFGVSGGGSGKNPVKSPTTTIRGAVRSEQSSTTTTTSPFSHVPPGPPSDQRRLNLIDTIGGDISPKSVDASDTGLVFAQNMMYRHTMTVYDSSGNLVKTIPDTVDMSQFGFSGHPGTTHGAPVEAAFTPDSKYVYVSNYSMYGAGFGPEGSDTCTPASAQAAGDTNSYVYRVDTKTLAIDQVIEVGLVPKFLAVSPDGKWLVVSNWCSYDVSIVNTASATQVARIPVGAYPRGIAVSVDSSTAYIAIMGGDDVVKIDLASSSKVGDFYVGSNPRHLVMSPDGRYLYVTLNGPGKAVKVDLSNDQVVASTYTGADERSMAIATDGLSLYVVNYLSDTVTKLRTSDMSVLQTVQTGVHPVGITYDATTGDVWVAVYTGQILVFADR